MILGRRPPIPGWRALLCGLLILVAAPLEAATIEKIRSSHTESRTRIVLDLDALDGNAQLRHEAIRMAHEHKGTSFVRIIQRCPVYVESIGKTLQDEPARLKLLTHEKGVQLDDSVKKLFPNHAEHDPSDLAAALTIAADSSALPLGILYRNPDAPRYDLMSAVDEVIDRGYIDEERLYVTGGSAGGIMTVLFLVVMLLMMNLIF